MCCATKNALISVILWLLALIGLSPVTPGWVDSLEQWIDYDQAIRPAIYAYGSTESQDLRAFVFDASEEGDEHLQPAVVTAFRTTSSQSEISDLYGVCSDLAELGYVAIAFEMPAEQESVSVSDQDTNAQLVTAWLVKSADDLGVDIFRTVLIAMEGQALPDFEFHLDPKTAGSTAENGWLVIPAGLGHFPDELIPFLPALP
jgi:hypothetical protein